MLGAVAVLTPVIALIASWIPAMLAAGQDAATVLAEEL
jgi:ABC-type lipoprotein release transport system permease subunit